jgi:putative acetyltransferase
VNDNHAQGLALRPMLPADLPLLAEIFQASIEGLTGEDYSPAQQEAWMAAAEEGAEFGRRLAGQLTLVATEFGTPVGFASLRGCDELDLLYVRPELARQGVATMLLDALEKLAAARGARRLVASASDTALPFFEQRGFRPLHRETVERGGEWLGRTLMEKGLEVAARPRPSP